MLPWLAPVLTKVPRKMWFVIGAVVVGLAFLWTFWSFAQADAKKDAALQLSRAQAAAAKKYADDTARLANDFALAQQGVRATETIVIRETADAAREIQSAPGADNVVDAAAWAAARGAIKRLRTSAPRERSDPATVLEYPAKP